MSTIKVTNSEHESTGNGGIQLDNAGHVTVDNVQMPTAGALSNRNLILNGAMQAAQRGTSVTGIGVDDYTCCDRFKHFAALSGQAGRLTATQENITDLAGFHKALKLQVTTAETPGSTESYGLNTRLELQDIKGLGVGTSAAVPLTLSFYAKAPTGSGVFCAGVIMSGGGSYIEEVNVGTSWSRHEINIPATTTSSHASTQTNDTHTGMEVQITLMAGSSRDDHGNGTWEADTANRATSNQSNFFSSTSNNLFITGVQLERGKKATPFEHRSFGDELARCMRYYETGVCFGMYKTSDDTMGWAQYSVQKRVNPSLNFNPPGTTTSNNQAYYYSTDSNDRGNRTINDVNHGSYMNNSQDNLKNGFFASIGNFTPASANDAMWTSNYIAEAEL